jgi:hypothetical protein
MKDPESSFTIIRSVRFTPGMFWMIREEALRRGMTVSSFLRYCAVASIRHAHTELA